MDEDLEEMRRLRRSRGYAEHMQQGSSTSSFSQSLHQHFGVKPKTKSSYDAGQLDREREVHHRNEEEDRPSFAFQRPKALPTSSGRHEGDAEHPHPRSQNHHHPQTSSQSQPAPSVNELDTTALNEYGLPITHEVVMKGHTRGVSALALEPSGARLISGGLDYFVRLWDFNGMDKRMKAFRELEVEEGHQIVDVSYSCPKPNRFLAVPASAQAVIYDRDGRKLCQFIRGDMYLRDMKHTKGHVMGMVGGQWHPTETNIVMTASTDGTVRLWDVENHQKNRDVIKVKAAKGGRLAVTACTMNGDGKIIVAACKDGTLQLWNNTGRFIRPKAYVKNAHVADTETSRLVISDDNHTLLSRGGDDTLKVWDLRKFQNPVKEFSDLPNFVAQTEAIFSPDNSTFATCVSAKRGKERGSIVFYNRATLSEVQRVSVADASCVRLLWHEKLNQIFVGCSDNNIHVLHDPEKSKKGVLLCAGRKVRKKDPSDFQQAVDIYAPHTLPMFQKRGGLKRQREKDSLDPVKGRIPQLPLSGRGTGGEVGSSFAKYFMDGIAKDPRRDLDPREALLAYEEKSKNDPVFLGKAYQKTQPVPIYAEEEPEDDEKEDDAAQPSS